MNVRLADPIRPPMPAPLRPRLERLLPRLEGRVALAVPPLGAPDSAPLAGAARRRMARLLLQDAAEAGNGQVFETLDGSLLLLGGLPRLVRQAAAALEALSGLRLGPPWLLPRDAPALLAWADHALLPPPLPTPPPPAMPGLAGLDARLATLAPERLLRSCPLRRPLKGARGPDL
ncbi:hypothetical protein JYK14_04400, partial [Siccirubricoccus sp. KC 17139]